MCEFHPDGQLIPVFKEGKRIKQPSLRYSANGTASEAQTSGWYRYEILCNDWSFVDLIGERRVHRADAFAFLADQKEVCRAGKSAQRYLLRRIIPGNRRHIQVVGEQDASEPKALLSTTTGIFHVKGSRAIRDRQPDRPHGRSSYS